MSANPEPVGGDRHDGHRGFGNEDGFTLVEVLIAFTVMATLLSVLFRSVVMIGTGALSFDIHTHQEIVAQAVLDDALANRGLAPGTYTGIKDGLHWRLLAKLVDLTAQLPPPQLVDSAQEITDSSGQASSPAGQAAQFPPAKSGDHTAKADSIKSQWRTQRLTVHVDTGGRSLEIETIRLSKGKESP